MDLNYDGSSCVKSCLSWTFLTIISGFKPQPFLYRMDLNYNESQKGSLRVHFLAVFDTDISTMVSGVIAPHHHLMMDLKLAKLTGKPLGHYPRPQSIVDFNLDALDGRSLSLSWFMVRNKTKDSD